VKKARPDERKRFFIYLLIICSSLSVFMSIYIAHNDKFISVHEFEYYTRTVFLARSSGLEEFSYHYFQSLPNKVIYFRSIIPMMIFGYTREVFRISSAVFNIFLILWLYYWCSKATSPEESFFYSLLLMFSYPFLELLGNPYVDLTLLIFVAVYLMQLYLFHRQDLSLYLTLNILLTGFMMFMSKNTSYVLLPILLASNTLYLFISRDRKGMHKALWLAAVHIIAFFIYWGIMGMFSENLLVREVSVTTYNYLHQNIHSAFGQISSMLMLFLQSGIKHDIEFINMLDNRILNYSLLLAAAYLAFRKKDRYWLYMLGTAIVFQFFFMNIMKEPSLERRFFLPFFPLSVMLLFFAIWDVMQSVDVMKKNRLAIFSSLAVLLLVISSISLANMAQPGYSMNYYQSTLSLNKEVFGVLPECSKVFVDSGPFGNTRYYEGFSMILDLDHHGLGQEVCSTEFNAYDPRFRYIISNNVSAADYVMCRECASLDLSGFTEVSRYSFHAVPPIELTLYRRNIH
jgi:hypothetical protein